MEHRTRTPHIDVSKLQGCTWQPHLRGSRRRAANADVQMSILPSRMDEHTSREGRATTLHHRRDGEITEAPRARRPASCEVSKFSRPMAIAKFAAARALEIVPAFGLSIAHAAEKRFLIDE